MMLNLTAAKDEKTISSSLLPALDQPCRRFSMAELISATDNFDKKWCIGQGGFGKVYKGKISNGTTNTYAIKRLHFMSDQGEPEFWVEVETLSRLRHCNLVSLIGYCNEEKDMALVYEYMHNGTLCDHLHKKGTILTWSQRLRICIGAARGLDYLHIGTDTQHGVIHRDVKSSNILLDENYAAKIADFGLAKIGPTNQTCTYVSTAVKGTFGYMDPSYFYTGRLTRKSDVYAFGVVLLEVLCGRPALDASLDEGLAIWAQDRIKQGKLAQIIDSRLRDQISRSSLKQFSRIALRCLLSNPNQRPTMSEVIGSLDLALSFQERKVPSTQKGNIIKKVWSLLSLSGHFKLRGLVKTRSNDQVPAVESFQIVGDAFPGGELVVCGYSVNGAVTCKFQWVHCLPDGSTEYIEGATGPTYTVASDDLGTCLGVEVIPRDKNGRYGKLYKCFANNELLMSESVIVPVSSIVTDVETYQIDPLEGQDDNNDPLLEGEDDNNDPLLEGEDNNDPLPLIESLQITGNAHPGGELHASGFSVNRTVSCMFKWFHHLPDGSIEYITDATSSVYTVTLGDVGTYLGIEVEPMDKNGRKSISYKCFANNGHLIGETIRKT